MLAQTFSEPGTLFANQANGVWERLGYVRDSYKSRGALGPVRFGEETIPRRAGVTSLQGEGWVPRVSSRCDSSRNLTSGYTVRC